MNNLKRVLSLALSGIMLVGMMAVGAGAVNGKDFTDADKIQNSEAVNTLVTLNVINGKDDGSHYDPEGTLTRAEMAKLIVYVLNGGVEPVMSTKATPTYSDIGGHWAEKYIEYCSNLGIIAGQGDGTFNPGGTLTGSQAAKMMLTAMNYNSDVFHFTGADWELSVNSEANKAKLYKGLTGLDASAPISRDDAAQLVYNGIMARTMERKWSQNMNDLHITENYELSNVTLFSDKFNGAAYEGVLHAAGKYAMAGAGTKSAGSGKFAVNVDKVNSIELGDGDKYDGEFKFDEDLTPLMGQYVKVLYNTKDKIVYGVYNVADSNNVYTTTANNLTVDADTIELDSTVYNKDSGFKAYGINTADSKNGKVISINTNTADDVKLVDNDADGDIDVAIVTNKGVAKVTFVGTDSITLSDKGGQAKLKASNQKTKDLITYDGVKKDDYVVYYRDMNKDKDVIVKAELTDGEINGAGNYGSGDYDDGRFQISGKWYKKAAGILAGSVYTSPRVGDTVKMVTLENKLYYMEKTSGAQSVENVAMLITGNDTDKVNGNQARLLFSDGSKKVVTLDKTSVDLVKTNPQDNIGLLYSYEVTNAGEYKLTKAAAGAWGDGAKMGDYTWVASGSLDMDKGTVASHAIADNATVFVFAPNGTHNGALSGKALDAANDGMVMTGKELKSMTLGSTQDKIAAATNGYFHSDSNGLTRATIIAVTLGSLTNNGLDDLMGRSSNNYGYLVSDATYSRENGTYYINMKLWNGEETIDVKWAKSNAYSVYGNFTKHSVIGYDVKSAGEITNVVAMNDTDRDAPLAVKAAITGLDGKDISFTTATGAAGSIVYKITGDTKILYVDSNADSADAIGVADGTIQTALVPAGTDKNRTPVFVQNAKYLLKTVNGEDKLELLVYDVDNRLADRDARTVVGEGGNITMSASNVSKIRVEGSEYTTYEKLKMAAGDRVEITVNKGTKIKVTGLIAASNAAVGTTDRAVTYTAPSDANQTFVFIAPKNGVAVTIITG